jgi:N-acetylglucosaminyldiphosphoundecaprenol N-acetyl-beta-D-mannosaminyltransferase
MSANERKLRTQVNLLGAWIDPVSHSEALAIVLDWCKTRGRQYVVTANLDHCRLLRTDRDFEAAYEQCGLSLPDGWPLVAASRVSKYPIKQRITGSDFIIPLCHALEDNNYTVFFFGSSADVQDIALRKIKEICPNLNIVGAISPPYGFEKDEKQLKLINEKIIQARPNALIVALGAPKQELWMASHVRNLPVGVAIGVGGTLDFLAGKQRRAPHFFQATGMEWLWRALSDPPRLGKRYLAVLAILPLLAFVHLHRHLIQEHDGVRQKLGPR